MRDRNNELGDEKKEKYVKAYVIGNLGDPGLDNDFYCDIKSRFIVAIKNEDKIPFVLKPGKRDKIEPSLIGDKFHPEEFNTALLSQDNIILVKTPEATWIDAFISSGDAETVKQGILTGLIRQEHNGQRRNIGARDSLSLNEIPKLNKPYNFGDEITVQKLTSEITKEYQTSLVFKSEFPLVFKTFENPLFPDSVDFSIGIIPNGYYDGKTSGNRDNDFENEYIKENKYGEGYTVVPVSSMPKYEVDAKYEKSFNKTINIKYAGGEGNYFHIAYRQDSYEAAVRQLLTKHDSDIIINLNNIQECWTPNGSKVPKDYQYAFPELFSIDNYDAYLQRFKKNLSGYGYPNNYLAGEVFCIWQEDYPIASSKWCKFSACIYEEVNSDRKREADSSCIPNVVVSPFELPTPSERKTALIDFNIQIPEVFKI